MLGQTVNTLGNSVSTFGFFAYTVALTGSAFVASLVSGCVVFANVMMSSPPVSGPTATTPRG
ncbi:MAG: hypothetical protein Q4A82_01770 [Corynebacterium sp.]|nr:hypothetical protein [Corynebacterium sp.]